MALGAQHSQIIRLVVFAGMRLALAGMLVGLLLAIVLGRLITAMLVGVKPTDPATFVRESATRVWQ